SRPSRSAASIIERQMRSFTLPPGFWFSSLAHTSACTPSSCGSRVSRTTGVEPMSWRTERATCAGIGMCGVAAVSKNDDSRAAKDASIDVVALFPGALGDLVLMLPALRAWRARHPSARLTLAVAGWLRALAATSGVADAYASVDDADAVGLF